MKLTKMWTSERERASLAATFIRQWAEHLEIAEDTRLQAVAEDLMAIVKRLETIDSQSLSRQMPPTEVPDPQWPV